MRIHRSTGTRRRRRGIALADAIVGGVMLGMGIAVLMSTTTRSLTAQRQGERRMTAAWLADEVLNMVLVEGPQDYSRSFDTSGRFDPPFDGFGFDVLIEDIGRGAPYRVTAVVNWGPGSNEQVVVETQIAQRIGDEPNEPREPEEEVDRDARWYPEEDF